MTLKKKKINNKQKGFTLIEVMIAMAFISIAFLGCAALYIQSSSNISAGNNLTDAAFIAKSRIDEFKNRSVASINSLAEGTDTMELDYTGKVDSTFGDVKYTRVTTIAETDSGDGRFITVTVSWNQPMRGPREVSYSALVRGGGL